MQKSLGYYVYEKFLQYELMTAVYVMEPWEKTLFNAILLIIVSLSFATFYQYTPVMVNKVSALL
ncbi:hypothetical protein BDB00DRAFT_817466 [Zychaea mexicana]|uniref:uncharacterized protein n=1 Tax=Zychaea mexicana TaxID=64656 RepID=UPI0022FE5CA6|nr:uncharacterized protein BDB00DRAFT_817466 [Zychaea mexicana]KAI9494602.1 hypothetical protein BDB00DRAFT_817466 [Zychaea mexicana]